MSSVIILFLENPFLFASSNSPRTEVKPEELEGILLELQKKETEVIKIEKKNSEEKPLELKRKIP